MFQILGELLDLLNFRLLLHLHVEVSMIMENMLWVKCLLRWDPGLKRGGERERKVGRGCQISGSHFVSKTLHLGGKMGTKKPNMSQHTWMGRKAAEILSGILVEMRAGVTSVSPTPRSTTSSKLNQFQKVFHPPSSIIVCPRGLLRLCSPSST